MKVNAASESLEAGAELDIQIAEALGWSYRERPMADIKYPDGRRILQGAAYELWDRDGNIQGIGKTHESARCYFTEEPECADLLKDALHRLGIHYTIQHGDAVTVGATIRGKRTIAAADNERLAMGRFAIALHESGVCLELPLEAPQMRLWQEAN